jgi:TonB-linked SusC/RagA family outer membrane protein
MKLFYKLMSLCQQSSPPLARHISKAVLLLIVWGISSLPSYAQNRTITGTVTDRVQGLPVPGVSVKLKDTKTIAVTDANGKYTINVPAGPVTLIYIYIGYATQELKVEASVATQNVALSEDDTKLNEVVVIGYGTQKRTDITSAIVTIDSKEILKSPTSNVTNSLVGRVTGLTAVQQGGQPGRDAANINIRGISTYNNASAIVVVDGIERPEFGNIDPNEIESISVLKDAASTAVYGIRGANGVIVVTTKGGKEGRPRISYSGNYSRQSFTGLPKTLNSYDNARLINEANRNDGLTETWGADELQKFKDGSDPLGYPDVNWIDYLTKDSYGQTQHNINVSGGTKVIRYYVSAGYLNQDGIFKQFYSPFGINTTPNFNRYNFRSNLEINLSKDLTVGVRLGGRLEKIYTPSGLRSSFPYNNFEGLISRALQTPNFAFPVTLPDGRIAQNSSVGTNIWNPLAVISRFGTRNDDNNTIESTFNLNYKLDAITKGLSFKTTFAYDSYFTSNTERNANWAAYKYDRKTGVVTLESDKPRDEPLSTLIATSGGTINTNLQSGFNYQRSFGKHNLSGLVLFTRQLIKLEGSTAFTSPPKASQGVVNRIGYNYDEKYYAEFNASYNGSENFAPGYRYGFFPAVSAGWNVHREEFLKGNKTLTYLKIRGSYGKSGNDQLDSRFLYLTEYAVTTGGIQFGLPTSLVNYSTVALLNNLPGNPLITWETGTKRNIGFESRWFKDALKFNVDVFDETRKDILTTRQSGLLTYGLDYPRLNIGEVYNKGYEAELDYQGQAGEVSFGMNAQISFSRNKIINKDEPINGPDQQKQQGKRVGQFFGFKTDGFYKSQEDINNSPVNQLGAMIPGDIKFVDVNGDGVINNDDRTAIGYSRNPEYSYSFSPRIAWKGFALSVLFQGVANVSSDLILSENNNGQQMYEFMLDRWTPETASTATWPALHSRGTGFVNYNLNDMILQNAAYLKIRNAEISWTVPAKWAKSLRLGSLRLFANGQNLYTWTKFKMYYDPENINLAVNNFSKQSLYPSSKVYNFGINLQL